MGEIIVEVQLENSVDRALAQRGIVEEIEIRNQVISAVADTGARLLTLPEEIVEPLGLPQIRTAMAVYADGRRDERPILGNLGIRIGDREMVGECMVVPRGSDALVGQVVLETLDLIADCAEQTLHPRADSPDRPLMRA